MFRVRSPTKNVEDATFSVLPLFQFCRQRIVCKSTSLWPPGEIMSCFFAKSYIWIWVIVVGVYTFVLYIHRNSVQSCQLHGNSVLSDVEVYLFKNKAVSYMGIQYLVC